MINKCPVNWFLLLNLNNESGGCLLGEDIWPFRIEIKYLKGIAGDYEKEGSEQFSQKQDEV